MIRLGKYTVIARTRFDNPFWSQYVVYIGEIIIGKSFSMPDLGCCAWLERQYEAGRTVYAATSAPLQRFSMGAPIKRGRPTNAERARRAALPEEVT
jgi:hypothetical protein